MLDYEWGNLVTGDDPAQEPVMTRLNVLDHYTNNNTNQQQQQNSFNDVVFGQQTYQNHQFNINQTLTHQNQFHSLYNNNNDTTAYNQTQHHIPVLSLENSGGGENYFMVPKNEEVSRPLDFSSRLGLNLGGRTYFSTVDDDFVNRLYRRPRPGETSLVKPRCQAEGCNADLTHSKHYHRRHKVCEFHSKASTVIAAGLTQRFCQQCSRFHLLSEFDNGKRSCRRRLADHNRRRRKFQQPDQESNNKSPQPENGHNSSSRSPEECGPQSTVTVAVSPPRMSLDSFRQRSYSSTSTSSLFFSSG